MIPYWVVFLVPIFATLLPFVSARDLHVFSLFIFLLLASFLIGLRIEVGADWFAYERMFDAIGSKTFSEAIRFSDPAYALLNWICFQFGLGVVGVNTVCVFLFIYGLLQFCKSQPLPWLAISIAVPYLIIVVGMGYTRQAVAIGFVLWALTVWRDSKSLKFFFLVSVAVLFHKSAIVMMPFAFLMQKKSFLTRLIIITFLIILMYVFFRNFFASSAYLAYFVNNSYFSSGALIRVIMNLIPTIILFIFYRRFSKFDDRNLWMVIGFLSIISFFSVQVLSTATDRFALYLSPIQIAVFSRIPLVVNNKLARDLSLIGIMLFYTGVLYVWLNHAVHASYWVPYNSIFQ